MNSSKVDERQIPVDGINPYAQHPGFDAPDCSLRSTVTQRGSYGGVRGGFRCDMTGGHCLPGAQCAALRERAAASDALENQLREARANTGRQYFDPMES